jgi:formylmethanofuran dehydrogenase subunit E
MSWEPEVTERKIKEPLRGVVRCKECLWYIGNNMLRDREKICPLCYGSLEDK